MKHSHVAAQDLKDLALERWENEGGSLSLRLQAPSDAGRRTDPSANLVPHQRPAREVSDSNADRSV